jgi:hypothetical protein
MISKSAVSETNGFHLVQASDSKFWCSKYFRQPFGLKESSCIYLKSNQMPPELLDQNISGLPFGTDLNNS